ncbi:hypothetical protein CFC21_028187 [Triticum aestivum]|uniref:Uncharacterized protein n=2 Tax=Triticum aestivum TaxID=4565 RepID=A0A9R1JEP7_WHEAT|nr:hypothetical protein CFC21_028187 [Triticum aestivum]
MDALQEWWPDARRRLSKLARKGFDSIVLLIVWSLWIERNARTFDNSLGTAAHVCTGIVAEADLWSKAGAVGLQSFLR